MDSIANHLAHHLALGNPTTFRNLTIFPIFGDTPGRQRNYIGLSEAVQNGTATVSEVSHGGSVPELTLTNTGKQPVLVLDGEELIGAKQNRTANVTLLAPAGTTLRIPVTCVEAGRWSYATEAFAPSEQVHFKKGRRSKMESVTRSLEQSGSRDANQAQVWSEIDDLCDDLSVATATGAMSDAFDTHRGRVEDYVAAFGAERGQVGAVFAIDARIEGLELFDCEQTLAEMLPKLVRSYAIEAVDESREKQLVPTTQAAREFIERLAGANLETYPAIGLGTELRLTTPGVIAGGLAADDRIVHLVAFASAAQSRPREDEQASLFESRIRRRGFRPGR